VLIFYASLLKEPVLEKVNKIDKKLDELKEFLEDVFLTPEEAALLKDADRAVRERSLRS